MNFLKSPVVDAAGATPLLTVWSVADKVYLNARDVRDQGRTFFERRRKCDPMVAGVDGNWPAKATGKRDVYISKVSAHFHVEECKSTCAFVGEETAVNYGAYKDHYR